MKNTKVTQYELQSDKVIATIANDKTEIYFPIDREVYESWLTNGSGVIKETQVYTDAVGAISEHTETYSIAEYWNQGASINNTPIIMHLQQYVDQCVGEQAIQSAFIEADILELVEAKNADMVKMLLIAHRSANYIRAIDDGNALKSAA